MKYSEIERRKIERLGIALVAAIGLIHLLYAPEEFEEARYMGLLFGVNFLMAVAALYGIARRQAWGWLLGLLLASGSMAGYALSRSVGMPGMEVEEWLVPIGIVSLTLEGLLVVVVCILWPRITRQANPLHGWMRGARVLAPYATVLAVVIVSMSAWAWLSRTEQISQEALEQEYGLHITGVVTTMLGGIVDVRMVVTDPEKAYAIFNDHSKMPYVRVANSDMVLLPPPHGAHAKHLLAGRSYFMFFPNPGHIVVPGAQVSLVFGEQQLPPITVE
jgi:hypothetical protein